MKGTPVMVTLPSVWPIIEQLITVIQTDPVAKHEALTALIYLIGVVLALLGHGLMWLVYTLLLGEKVASIVLRAIGL